VKIIASKGGYMQRIAKDLVKLKGKTPQEASDITGVSVADILREFEEPAVTHVVVAPDGTKKEYGRE